MFMRTIEDRAVHTLLINRMTAIAADVGRIEDMYLAISTNPGKKA